MSFVALLEEYFRAEKHLGIALAVLGVALLAAAVWVFRTQTGAFAWWLLVPLALLGIAFGGGGAFLANRSHHQITDLAAQFERAPRAFVAAEVPRMERVNANWRRAMTAWAVVIAIALVLILAVRRDWSSGLGLALLLMATTLYFVDVFAERRALVYTEALRKVAADLPAAPR
jgi:hypothetical protein